MMIKNGKRWGAGLLGGLLGLSSFAVVACGDDDDDGGDGPVGGAAGSGGAAAGGDDPVGGGGGTESGGAGGGAGAGQSGGGAVGSAGDAPGGAGTGAGGAGCSYEGESYEVSERFVGFLSIDASNEPIPSLCTCAPTGEVTCVEQYAGCDLLLRDMRDAVDRAKTCDRDGPLNQCGVEGRVNDFFCGPWWGLFTAEHVGELAALTELGALSSALDCGASITPCGDGPKPTESFCSESNRCVDRWTGQNQIDNGGFEALDVAGRPEKWSIAFADRPAFSIDADAKSGDAALKVSVGQLGYEYEVSQSPSGGHRFIDAGSRLRVTGYYRIDALGGDVSFAVGMGNAHYPIEAPTEAGVWKEFRVDTYATGQHRFTLGLIVQQNAGPLVDVWFDDVQVELLP